MNIRDYILNDDVVEKSKSANRTVTEYTYKMTYENDTDCIFSRETGKTKVELVVLISQGQIYIKNKNGIQKVDNISQIKNFFKHIGYWGKNEDYFSKLGWAFSSNKYNAGKICYDNLEYLIQNLSACKFLMNKKINPFNNKQLVDVFNKGDETTCKRYLDAIKIYNTYFFDNNSWYKNDILRNIALSGIQANTFKANIDLIEGLGKDFSMFWSCNKCYEVFTQYKCDFRVFFTYLLYTIKYRNGLGINHHCCGCFDTGDYLDYLNMQIQMYGKMKEKYPLYWLSEHNMMVHKYNDFKKLHKDECFSINQEKIKDVEYKDEHYSVIVPTTNTDILDEADQQQHCVASYIDKIVDGETHILFIRDNVNLDASLLTVELSPDRSIVQVRGFQNRLYTKDEYEFMKKWADERKLKLSINEIS